jgi:oxaloacetate decarboxylase alpha subunit
MTSVRLVDVSIRDGNQSLWGATGLNTAQILEIAPTLERCGLVALDFTSSTTMAVAARYFRENPWERIRLMRAACATTKLQFIGTGFRFISWETADPSFMRLAYRKLIEAGIGKFIMLDPMHDAEALLAASKMACEEGADDIMAALTFTLSDVHDDAFYAGFARQVTTSPYVHRAYIKDPSGLLSPERARTLIPAVQANMNGKPLEIHAHCTIGLGPLTSLVAAELGIETIHVGIGALGNGSSLPPALRTVANLRELGHAVEVDDFALARADDYFNRLADAEGLPHGMPQEFDAAYLRHQMAGGTMTTTRRQLKELGLENRWPDVIAEVPRVRAELGQPIMVTPFPQMVCTQALFNVIGAERYAQIPDQVIRYVMGRFGRPTRPVDPNVKDRILATARAKDIAAEPPAPTVAELRKKFGAQMSDEELLLRAVMAEEQIDAMKAAGPAKLGYNPDTRPLKALIADLAKRKDVSQIVVEKPSFKIALTAHGS